jgi:hypothetical protein
MRTEVIPNLYDGPHEPKKRLGGGSFSLDYVNSDNAAEIDRGIRETVKGIRLSILAVGVGLAKIKAQGLYIDLNYHSMAQYLESLCEQTRMDRSSLHNWLYIGEAYLKYRKELERVGFSDEDGPTKLPYVDRAMAIYRKQDVFRAVKDMSLRQFISFSRGGRRSRPPWRSPPSGCGGTRSGSGTGWPSRWTRAWTPKPGRTSRGSSRRPGKPWKPKRRCILPDSMTRMSYGDSKAA